MRKEMFAMTQNARMLMSRHVLVGFASMLLAIMLAGGLALVVLPQMSPRALAASLQQVTGATCAQAPTMQHCNNQDPEVQGCATDAQTLSFADIQENGI